MGKVFSKVSSIEDDEHEIYIIYDQMLKSKDKSSKELSKMQNAEFYSLLIRKFESTSTGTMHQQILRKYSVFKALKVFLKRGILSPIGDRQNSLTEAFIAKMNIFLENFIKTNSNSDLSDVSALYFDAALSYCYLMKTVNITSISPLQLTTSLIEYLNVVPHDPVIVEDIVTALKCIEEDYPAAKPKRSTGQVENTSIEEQERRLFVVEDALLLLFRFLSESDETVIEKFLCNRNLLMIVLYLCSPRKESRWKRNAIILFQPCFEKASYDLFAKLISPCSQLSLVGDPAQIDRPNSSKDIFYSLICSSSASESKSIANYIMERLMDNNECDIDTKRRCLFVIDTLRRRLCNEASKSSEPISVLHRQSIPIANKKVQAREKDSALSNEKQFIPKKSSNKSNNSPIKNDDVSSNASWAIELNKASELFIEEDFDSILTSLLHSVDGSIRYTSGSLLKCIEDFM
eukprot:MONOS_1141.1-p1 / transcript=MONOS_1141.1 / gene=MONOS_1141 / organism=Monocercomonoides_exilis_PA203 / gene_product=unspecified product / transcript_product=unspecified product / location=Mono_scaffold00019:149185-150942(+) / protein_length=461 / sequence_SO=supercontig / SO=protein_coding / is_pseudo=false